MITLKTKEKIKKENNIENKNIDEKVEPLTSTEVEENEEKNQKETSKDKNIAEEEALASTEIEEVEKAEESEEEEITETKKRKKKKAKKKKFNIVEKIILIFFLITFCVCAGMIGWKFYKDYTEEKAFQEISDEKRSIEELQEQNPDTIGWIRIPGTIIDYPVMWTPEFSDYYLDKNFEEEFSSSGSIYLSARSNPNEVTPNWLVHGHSMYSGTMFRDLLEYTEKDFLDENPTFTFETVEGEKTYQIIAVLETQVFPVDTKEFAYYDYDGLKTESEYNAYVNGLWANSTYLVGDKPSYPQQLISLSTCAKQDIETGRLVIVGLEVEEEEKDKDKK